MRGARSRCRADVDVLYMAFFNDASEEAATGEPRENDASEMRDDARSATPLVLTALSRIYRVRPPMPLLPRKSTAMRWHAF